MRRQFALEEPGREVLEISAGLRNPDAGVRSARDWVETEARISRDLCRGMNSFGSVASRARSRQERSRAWSDATEDALRKQVRAVVACLIPAGAPATAILYPCVMEPSLSFSARWDGQGFDCPQEKAVAAILNRLDVSAFRGVSPWIELLRGQFSAHERATSFPALLEILSGCGFDASAARHALARADYAGLLQIVSPEAYDEALRKKAREAERRV